MKRKSERSSGKAPGVAKMVLPEYARLSIWWASALSILKTRPPFQCVDGCGDEEVQFVTKHTTSQCEILADSLSNQNI